LGAVGPALFDPLVDRKTWATVQNKLARKEAGKRTNAPRTPAQYLSGIVYCGNCGKRMRTGSLRRETKNPRKDGYSGPRYEYFCGTWHKAVASKTRESCSCLRNGIFQDVFEGFIDRYLVEAGKRLEVFTQAAESAPGGHVNRMFEEESGHYWQFMIGMEELEVYLRKHAASEYRAILEDSRTEDATAHEYVAACLECYRSHFDPDSQGKEIERLEEEHTELMGKWADLPTDRAKEKARERFKQLEAKIDELRRRQRDVSEIVEKHYTQLNDLYVAVEEAKRAMEAEASERSYRQKAEALRAVIQRVECTFEATGKNGSGWGNKNSDLVKVTVYPVVGDAGEFSAPDSSGSGTLIYSSAHSFIYRTRVGRMR
jgi:hypothetical protein